MTSFVFINKLGDVFSTDVHTSRQIYYVGVTDKTPRSDSTPHAARRLTAVQLQLLVAAPATVRWLTCCFPKVTHVPILSSVSSVADRSGSCGDVTQRDVRHDTNVMSRREKGGGMVWNVHELPGSCCVCVGGYFSCLDIFSTVNI